MGMRSGGWEEVGAVRAKVLVGNESRTVSDQRYLLVK